MPQLRSAQLTWRRGAAFCSYVDLISIRGTALQRVKHKTPGAIGSSCRASSCIMALSDFEVRESEGPPHPVTPACGRDVRRPSAHPCRYLPTEASFFSWTFNMRQEHTTCGTQANRQGHTGEGKRGQDSCRPRCPQAPSQVKARCAMASSAHPGNDSPSFP